jgi:hypothetical protein
MRICVKILPSNNLTLVAVPSLLPAKPISLHKQTECRGAEDAAAVQRTTGLMPMSLSLAFEGPSPLQGKIARMLPFQLETNKIEGGGVTV